ncbi:MAG: alpha/beta hydrolase [Eubacteriales bacterium]|nr:alpha/beta hydrolase [Eubacteriales bacterium]
MRTVFLHGLGQTAKDWDEAIKRASGLEADCPEIFSLTKGDMTYSQILKGLERRYADTAESFRICGISLGAMLALDYAIRHGNKVDSLILIGVQYKSPGLLIDFQNILFRCMPQAAFEGIGLSKKDVIKLTTSMRTLDFSADLKKIVCPVDIVCGEKDTANLKAAKKLSGLLGQAKLHIIPGAGHEVNKCAPEAIAKILS